MDHDRLSRRQALQRLGITGAALAVPGTLLAACGGSQGGSAAGSTSSSVASAAASPADLSGTTIKVATFGGFFEENFRNVYPDFTAETGIEVESVSEPGGNAWIVQLEQAVRSGAAPADVSMLGITSVLRAVKGDLLVGYSESDVPNSKFLADGFLQNNAAGDIVGVGAASWFFTLVSNTERVAESPTSWAALWDPAWKNELALNNQAATSFLLDITARTWFPDDPDLLTTDEGVLDALAKVSELKPNVKLWWRDEATAQQDFNSGEVSLGAFYHDITQYAASVGEPLRSVFPDEGAVLDSGMWGITRTTQNPEACIAFVDWMCQPQIQARLATTLGTSPTVALEHMDLTTEDYANVAGPGPDAAIRPAYPLYQEREDWLDQQWAEKIFSG